MKKIVIRLIAFYRIISPFKGQASCRFLPTCSDYAAQAIARHGTMKGSWLALKRICRCHPLGGHGIDEVP